MKYLTRDNITLVLSIIGSVGTIVTWFVAWLKSRKNISVIIVKICKTKNYLFMYLMITNNSRLPITINNVSIIHDDITYPCFELPTKILSSETRTGDLVKDTKNYYTVKFPINLSSLMGTSGYFAFDIPQEDLQTLTTPVKLQVCTNRGKAIEMKLPFEKLSNWGEMY